MFSNEYKVGFPSNVFDHFALDPDGGGADIMTVTAKDVNDVDYPLFHDGSFGLGVTVGDKFNIRNAEDDANNILGNGVVTISTISKLTFTLNDWPVTAVANTNDQTFHMIRAAKDVT